MENRFRPYIASAALTGLLAARTTINSGTEGESSEIPLAHMPKVAAQMAVELADELIAALDKTAVPV